MILPKLRPVTELLLQGGEVFIAAGGFEERGVGFARIVESRNVSHGDALIVEYVPYNAKNKLKEICSVLTKKGCNPSVITYDRYAPEGFDLSLRDRLRKLESGAVCLDISGMSRFAMMIIMDVVRELNLCLRVVYSEACEYAPSRKDFEAAKETGQQHLPTSFIHTGVYDVLHVSRLSSIRMQSQGTVLIAFDSFNEALCQALVNVINPARLILVNGQPPRKELAWREEATAYVHQFLRKEWGIEGDNDPIKTTSTLYYEETYRLLTELYWKLSDSHRIILAPTGSKMQTIGSYLVRAVHNDIHIEYPTVQGFFAEKYSTGIREYWQVDFGEMGDFVRDMRQREVKTYLGLPEELVDADID